MANEKSQSLPAELDQQQTSSTVSLEAAQEGSQASNRVMAKRKNSWFGSLKAAFQKDTLGLSVVKHDAEPSRSPSARAHAADAQATSDRPSLAIMPRPSYPRSISARDALSSLRKHLPSTSNPGHPGHLVSGTIPPRSSSELALNSNNNRKDQPKSTGARHKLVNSITGSLRHIRHHSKQASPGPTSTGPETFTDNDFVRVGINRPLPSSPINVPAAPPRLGRLDFGHDRLTDLEFLGTPEDHPSLMDQAARKPLFRSMDIAASPALSISTHDQPDMLAGATYGCLRTDRKADEADCINTIKLPLDASIESLPAITCVSPLQSVLPFQFSHDSQLFPDSRSEDTTEDADDQRPDAPGIVDGRDTSQKSTEQGPHRSSGVLLPSYVKSPSASEAPLHATIDVNELDADVFGPAVLANSKSKLKPALSAQLETVSAQRVKISAPTTMLSPLPATSEVSCSAQLDRVDDAPLIKDMARDLTPLPVRLKLQAIRETLPQLTRVEAHEPQSSVRSRLTQTEETPSPENEGLSALGQAGRNTLPDTNSSDASRRSMLVEYSCSPKHRSVSPHIFDRGSSTSLDQGASRLLSIVRTPSDSSEGHSEINGFAVEVANVDETNAETCNLATSQGDNASVNQSSSEADSSLGYVRLPSTELDTSSPDAFKPHEPLYEQEAVQDCVDIDHAYSSTASETSGISPHSGPLTADRADLAHLSIRHWTLSSDTSSGGDPGSTYDFWSPRGPTAEISDTLLADDPQYAEAAINTTNIVPEALHVERKDSGRLTSIEKLDGLPAEMSPSVTPHLPMSDSSLSLDDFSKPKPVTASRTSTSSQAARLQKQQVDAALQQARDFTRFEEEHSRMMFEGLEISRQACPVAHASVPHMFGKQVEGKSLVHAFTFTRSPREGQDGTVDDTLSEAHTSPWLRQFGDIVQEAQE